MVYCSKILALNIGNPPMFCEINKRYPPAKTALSVDFEFFFSLEQTGQSIQLLNGVCLDKVRF